MPRLLVLVLSAMALILQSCSGCRNDQQPPAGVLSEVAQPSPEAGVQGEPPPGFEEGSELGPTDEIEDPADQRDLVPATEPDINE